MTDCTGAQKTCGGTISRPTVVVEQDVGLNAGNVVMGKAKEEVVTNNTEDTNVQDSLVPIQKTLAVGRLGDDAHVNERTTYYDNDIPIDLFLPDAEAMQSQSVDTAGKSNDEHENERVTYHKNETPNFRRSARLAAAAAANVSPASELHDGLEDDEGPRANLVGSHQRVVAAATVPVLLPYPDDAAAQYPLVRGPGSYWAAGQDHLEFGAVPPHWVLHYHGRDLTNGGRGLPCDTDGRPLFIAGGSADVDFGPGYGG